MDIRDFIIKRISELQGDISDREFSRQIGKSPGYLQGLKNHHTLASIDTIGDICNRFDLTIEEFFMSRDTDVSFAEESFYRKLKTKIKPEDYEMLNDVISYIDDFHGIAEFFKKYAASKR